MKSVCNDIACAIGLAVWIACISCVLSCMHYELEYAYTFVSITFTDLDAA